MRQVIDMNCIKHYYKVFVLPREQIDAIELCEIDYRDVIVDFIDDCVRFGIITWLDAHESMLSIQYDYFPKSTLFDETIMEATVEISTVATIAELDALECKNERFSIFFLEVEA